MVNNLDAVAMLRFLSSNDVSDQMWRELHQWNVAEWGAAAFDAPLPAVPPSPSTLITPTEILAVLGENQLIGGLTFTIAQKPNDTQSGVWINTVLVARQHRRQGIATQLVRIAAQQAARHELDALFVLTHLPALYSKQGWTYVQAACADHETILTKWL